MPKLKVIDFFCGAGGFSEGFKQMGFEIVKGYDNWKPAIDTYNHNFGLNCETKNILDFECSIEEINKIPDTEIILGSPPCVSFSSSNKSGKADKSLGVKLTETFLRIVAVKKHKPNSTLKAWFMENVVNSKRYLQTEYTFKDLGLSDWANSNKISPNKIAINLYQNTTIVNSADYGSIQARKRVISGEIIKKKKLIIPSKTHRNPKHKGNLPIYRSIKELKDSFPNPYERKSKEIVSDVNYRISIPKNEVTDHFYDTGVYKVEWKFSKFWKQNHPYMGRMSFPENIDNPSRTITATKIANSRESIIYKSEIKRKGDGEYRLPTVREAALIMGFPITYQFLGSENTKWRLVGNAVCCPVSRALANTVIETFKLEKPNKLVVNTKPNLEGVKNLNNYIRKKFDKPPVKKKGARFRRHPIKDGNLTVTLSNYDIDQNSKTKNKWFTSIQYGTGEGFPIQKVKDGYFKEIEELIGEFKSGKKFLNIINNGFSEKIGTKSELQEMYEKQVPINNLEQPTELVDQIQEILDKVKCPDILFEQNDTIIFKEKNKVPLKQLFSLYAINKISSTANNK
ncbi:DNA cytosine methyltransferase [Winogradskyella poriferorum]|uniref:DNA cytosine methyltransferase n=1 Tax=Winogradskyella poriferorum TaxID=307627 RepID=UPI003D6623DF